MAGYFNAPLLPRRRRFEWIKWVLLIAFFWILIDYGFKQDFSSDFGEHLDRVREESFRKDEADVANVAIENFEESREESVTSNAREDRIVQEFLSHVSAKEALQLEQRNSRKKIVKKSTHKPEIRIEQPKVIVKVDREPSANSEKKLELFKSTPEKPNKVKLSFEDDVPILPGEQGEGGVTLPENLSEETQKQVDLGWKNFQFNAFVSDSISFRRNLPDYRTEYCKNIASNYSKNLPATSVIIIFYNEAFSTLLRTVHSVLDRSPEHLLTEVILVDDGSDMDHLKQQLDSYLDTLPKVKIIRAVQREGLIRARLMGAAAAKGPVLTFLDSHCECTTGWLEPMLDRIAIDPTNVVWPRIDIINDDTFEFIGHVNEKQDHLHVGGFNWKLMFDWISITEDEKERKADPSAPTRSPTMAGGLLAIDKAFFVKLGGYDPGFETWGGENLELSFKAWMCGGSVELIPCSRVGHVFRKKSPYTWKDGALRKNTVRLAEVWLDDYAKHFYARTGRHKGDFGNITERVELRKSLNCKSFQWFVDNVYPNIKVPGNLTAFGEIRNLGYSKDLCLDVSDDKEEPVMMYRCHESGGNQFFEFDKGRIGRDDYYIEYEPPNVMIKGHHHVDNVQLWSFNINSKQIYQKSTDACLTMTNDSKLVMETCSPDAEGQQWQLENLVPERLQEL